MSQTFLSQEEVDTLLRGVSDDDFEPIDFVLECHWFLNGPMYYIRVKNDNVRTWLYENYTEGVDFAPTTVRPKTNYVLPEATFVFLRLKFRGS